MKVINVSELPFEWTFDGCNYGPILAGEVQDYPEPIASHAIRKSAIVDDEGMILMHRIEALETVKAKPEWLRQVATYPCPFASAGMCEAAPFSSTESLKKHLDEHFLGGKKAAAKE